MPTRTRNNEVHSHRKLTFKNGLRRSQGFHQAREVRQVNGIVRVEIEDETHPTNKLYQVTAWPSSPSGFPGEFPAMRIHPCRKSKAMRCQRFLTASKKKNPMWGSGLTA